MVKDIPLIYYPTWAPEGAYEPEIHGVNWVSPPPQCPNGFKTLITNGGKCTLVRVWSGSGLKQVKSKSGKNHSDLYVCI